MQSFGDSLDPVIADRKRGIDSTWSLQIIQDSVKGRECETKADRSGKTSVVLFFWRG